MHIADLFNQKLHMPPLLSTAIIYHATYHLLVQSDYPYTGVMLPVLTYIPALLLLRRSTKKQTAKA